MAAGAALFAHFAKGAVFEFSFQRIQTMELTSLLLTYVPTYGIVLRVISKKPRVLSRRSNRKPPRFSDLRTL
jgi:hypothetical protein